MFFHLFGPDPPMLHWPPVQPVDRWGSGVAMTDGDATGMMMCETCATA
jgi:hypothetical protein